MNNFYSPVYRAWHYPTVMMYDVASIEWQSGNAGIIVIGISGQETGVSGPLCDFVLMRKSTHTDIDGFPIFSGDIIQLGQDTPYPGELLTVIDFEDSLCFNRGGMIVNISIARHGKVIGNVFQAKAI